MLAQSLFSHSQLHKKNTQQLLDMCYEKGSDWHAIAPVWKNGTFLYKEAPDASGFLIDNYLFFPKAREVIDFWTNYTEE